jgi:nitrite reductase/ring-hydroxylating ferredoxin subunit
MLQHILLLLIVPALLLFSLPRSLSLALGPRVFAHPLFGWFAGVGAMWFWHAPALCNAAVSSRPVHALQTVSLLALGGLFWRQILAPRDAERLSPPHAIFYLFSACVACSVLGIIITFSPVAVCSIYTMPPNDHLGMLQTIRNGWGFTPERDQQIGGLLMWVPMCLIYLTAILPKWRDGSQSRQTRWRKKYNEQRNIDNRKSGVRVGKVDSFKIGETTAVQYEDASPLPWAGVTARSAAWLRRVNADTFIAFSINCTHLGCPVRWLAEANLFMCPCHGGVYYKMAPSPPGRRRCPCRAIKCA